MRRAIPLTIAAATIALAACNGQKSSSSSSSSGPVSEAPSVPLVNASGQIIGEVKGGDSDKGAVLEIDAHGLPPGLHGIHIHDVGICQGPDFKSAGPHWNPTGKMHGGENPGGAHMGDLQNITVASDGTLKVKVVVPGTYLRNAGHDAAPGAAQILDASGAALVIHAKPDDYKTDPSGNSGDRIACAVLGAPEPGAIVSGGNATAPANNMAMPSNSAAMNAQAANMAEAGGNMSGH